MKILHRTSIHTDSRSHEMLLGEINGKKIKITYEAYNAVERCNTEIFDGNAWNHIFSLIDLGIEPNNGAFVSLGADKRQVRANYCFGLAQELCKLIL